MRAWWVAILVLMLPAGASAQVPVPPPAPVEPIIPVGASAVGLDIGQSLCLARRPQVPPGRKPLFHPTTEAA